MSQPFSFLATISLVGFKCGQHDRFYLHVITDECRQVIGTLYVVGFTEQADVTSGATLLRIERWLVGVIDRGKIAL